MSKFNVGDDIVIGFGDRKGRLGFIYSAIHAPTTYTVMMKGSNEKHSYSEIMLILKSELDNTDADGYLKKTRNIYSQVSDDQRLISAIRKDAQHSETIRELKRDTDNRTAAEYSFSQLRDLARSGYLPDLVDELAGGDELPF